MITDTMLTEQAKALNNESYVIPNYLLWATSPNPITAGMTTITSEQGARNSINGIRTGASVAFSGIRSGAVVTSPTGEQLFTLGVNSAITSGSLLTAVALPGFTHTTNFDIDATVSYGIIRR